MSFNFSAMQYERGFRAKSNSNWEYPRFSPPRPRSLQKNSKPISDGNGHLLPSARRDGNFLGQYRGTYHLPLRITRSFATLYNSCLSGRHKYWKYPRDLCCCQREQQLNNCDWRETLGKKDCPLWQRPKCQSKCEGLQQMLAINELHNRCKHVRCMPRANEKLIPRAGDSSMRNRKRLRKRPVTAFEFNRNRVSDVSRSKPKSASKDAVKDAVKDAAKDVAKDAVKHAVPAPPPPPPPASAPAAAKSTTKSPTKAAVKSKPKSK